MVPELGLTLGGLTLGFFRDGIDEVWSTAARLQDEICTVASQDAGDSDTIFGSWWALDGFGEKGQKSWTAEEKRKDRKALPLIQLHLYNDILQEVLQEKTAAELWLKLESICMSKDLTSKMHVKMKLFTHKLQERWFSDEPLIDL